ncbi:prepilin peptidase [Pseudarthrobacter sp. J1738]|uniref:prepilin peptidase n=1 Tax=unclassified Pseudarthrobacter TaxID=2647000 RepID=UPI003D2677DC
MIRRLVELSSVAPAAVWLLAAALVYFVWAAVRLSVIDIREHLLPNRIIFPWYGVAALLLAGAVLTGHPENGSVWSHLGQTALGGAVLWLAYFVLRVIYPPGMGFGDVKLAGILGLYLGYLGWTHVLAGTFLAFFFGGLWSIGLIFLRRGGLKSAIPFGPFMLLGAAVAMALLPA